MDYSYSASYSGQISPIFGIVYLVLLAFYIYCGWKLFVKAGQPGWAAIIPIYNAYIMLKIVGKPGWWLLLFLIPFVNFIVAIIVVHNLALRFGKGLGYTLGLLFLNFIFLPLLALGDSKYTPAPSAPTAM